jgi:predicted hydrolase (HD superfamily)
LHINTGVQPEKPEKNRRKSAMNGQSRESAWSLLIEYTHSESLRKHAMAVEACMRAYGESFACENGMSDSEAQALVAKYAITGLLHDFDYEKFPTPAEHPFVGNKILEERGYPEDVRRAILSHAEYSGVSRDTHMEKALFACDELAGFITATALVKPSKSIREVDARSIRKKMKDKAFARSVSRDDITNGAAELGADLDQHITFCIEAMTKIAGELGLAGTSDPQTTAQAAQARD